jgi:hypothetical protein
MGDILIERLVRFPGGRIELSVVLADGELVIDDPGTLLVTDLLRRINDYEAKVLGGPAAPPPGSWPAAASALIENMRKKS